MAQPYPPGGAWDGRHGDIAGRGGLDGRHGLSLFPVVWGGRGYEVGWAGISPVELKPKGIVGSFFSSLFSFFFWFSYFLFCFVFYFNTIRFVLNLNFST